MNEAVNPYAAPRAAVGDVYDQNAVAEPTKLFSGQGRIGRARFLAYSVYAYLVFGLIFGVLAAFIPLFGRGNAAFAVPVLMFLLMIPYLWFYIVTAVKRSHDMDWSGWWVLAMLIPLVALVWIFAAGSHGANRFGPPPPPNPLSVKIGAWLIVVFMALGILGMVAAVSLPAYQDYVQKSKAAQVEKP